MGLRERITAAMKEVDPDLTPERASTLRLLQTAIRDRDMAVRNEGIESGITDEEVRAILSRMAAQRRESARDYEESARLEQAERERAEVALIEEFLPRQISRDEAATAVDEAVCELGASSIRDLGRVMGLLKERYHGRMDFTEVGRLVKTRLARNSAANR